MLEGVLALDKTPEALDRAHGNAGPIAPAERLVGCAVVPSRSQIPRARAMNAAAERQTLAVANEATERISIPGPREGRELALRDVRDLALAVIEGAVAAESLAKELKKTPDRSKHFQEIAERLRSIVGRPSIRTALSEEASTSVAPLRLAVPPHLRTAEPVAETAQPPQAPRTSGEQLHVETDVGPHLERLESLLRALTANDASARLEARMARLEEAVNRAIARREEGERYALRTPEEAIALAARLTERLRRDPRVVVRIEP